MLTGDLNVIDVQWILQYRIEDPIRTSFRCGRSETIRDITEAVMRRVVGNRLGSDVLTVGRVAVSTTAKEEIQRILNAYETGVRLVTVELQDVTPGSREAGLQRGERVASGQRTDDQSGRGAGQPRNPQGRWRGSPSISEAEGYAIERVNRAWRGDPLPGHLGRVSAGPGGDAPAPASGGPGPLHDGDEGAVYRGQRSEGHGALAFLGSRGIGSQVDCRREVAVKTALQVSIIVVVVAILLVLSGTFYTVEEGQQAVIVQFGRPVGETVTEAGLHVKLPFVQGVRRFEKRLLTWDGDPNQIPTKGRSSSGWIPRRAGASPMPRSFWRAWPVKKGRSHGWTTSSTPWSGTRCRAASSSSSSAVPPGKSRRSGRRRSRRKSRRSGRRRSRRRSPGTEEITRTILAEARKIIPQYGIELVDVRIKRLDYIESVREKVYARMISERKRIAAQFRSEGEGRSAEVLGAMEKELRQIRSTAYRQVQELRGGADAEATRIYGEVYSRDPSSMPSRARWKSTARAGTRTRC